MEPPPDAVAATNDGDEQYFDAYTDPAVHQVMLQDEPRNDAYRAAIEAVVRGRVVLDVGAGTGLLSLLAARAGATRVYAVEASALVVQLQQNVELNGAAAVITVLHGAVEDVELPEKVDVLLSEWMVRLRRWCPQTQRCATAATAPP
jgi:predicted RNA methylase